MQVAEGEPHVGLVVGVTMCVALHGSRGLRLIRRSLIGHCARLLQLCLRGHAGRHQRLKPCQVLVGHQARRVRALGCGLRLGPAKTGFAARLIERSPHGRALRRCGGL